MLYEIEILEARRIADACRGSPEIARDQAVMSIPEARLGEPHPVGDAERAH